MEKFIPHIGRKLLFLSPYVLHLYQHYGCINEAEEDALTIAKNEVVYKLGLNVEVTEAGTEESSGYPAVPEPPPSAPAPEPRRTTTPQPRHDAGKEQPWRDINLSNFEFPEPLPANQSGTDPPSEPILAGGAHHPWSEPGTGQLWSREYSPRGSQGDGLVESRGTRDGENTTCCACGSNDAGAHSEERGNPEVGGTYLVPKQSP